MSRHFDDLDAVLEFDALTTFRNWFSTFNRRQIGRGDELEHAETRLD